MENRRDPALLQNKSYAFAIRIVKMVQHLQDDKKEYILSKQALRSGTAIGALIREAEFAQSTADYINKLSVSLKEANETDYWLNLLHDTKYIDDEAHNSIDSDCRELIAILVSSIKTLKKKIALPK